MKELKKKHSESEKDSHRWSNYSVLEHKWMLGWRWPPQWSLWCDGYGFLIIIGAMVMVF